MKSGLVEKIKSRGYTRVNLRPTQYAKPIEKLTDCERLVREHSVRLRGWDYPHYPQRRDEQSGLDKQEHYVQGWIDWGLHVEFWRMYQSGQFLHYEAFPEDWDDQHPWLKGQLKAETKIGVGGTVIYGLTEIFEFFRRLALTGLYGDGVDIDVEYFGLQNRELWVDDPGRHPFFEPKISKTDAFRWQKRVSHNDLLTKSKEMALETIGELVYLFDWEDVSLDAIGAQQDEFLSGRFAMSKGVEVSNSEEFHG